MEDGDPVDVAYLDNKKAFDSVPHQRLLKKLHTICSLGIRGRVLGWIEQFLVGRQQRRRRRPDRGIGAPLPPEVFRR